MKNFPASYAAFKDKKTGLHPVWILKLSVSGVDYYLSGSAFAVTPWGITTKKWIKSWGSIQEGITGWLEEFQISIFNVDILIDPDASPNIEDLATQYDIEESPVSLYCWFKGCSDPPQEFFRGYVKECRITGNVVSLQIQDETIRLERFFVGTKVDRTTYPSADPDDAGKVVPIIYGTVNKLPALAVDAGIMTSIPANINAVVTSFSVSDATGLTAGMILQIDDEQITIGSVSGDTLSGCTRGINSTIATAHQKGARIWQSKSEFVYLISDHALDSIPKVYGKVGDVQLDITAICTTYLGTEGNQHASYPGKACISIPGFITVAQAVSLGLTDTTDVVDTISVADTIALSDPGHYHNAAVSTNENTTTSLPASAAVYVGGKYGWNPAAGKVMNFPADGARATASYTVTIAPQETYSGVWVKIFVADVEQYGATWNFVNGSPFTVTFSVTGGTANAIDVCTVGSTPAFNITACSRVIQLSNNQSSSNQTRVLRTGSASKSGSAAKTGSVTLSGNSVANTLIGDELLVNVVRNITSPADVCSDLLAMAGFPAITTVGTIPAYTFNGAITEYKTALYWLNYWALQCRSFFKMSCGAAKLIERPVILTSQKIISACRIERTGARRLSQYKIPFGQIINTINLLFDRDWSKGRGPDGYKGNSKAENSTSITRYGRQENPSIFQFDFITDQVTANELRDYYLFSFSVRPWEHEFEVFLDQLELEFGDHIMMGFLNNKSGFILRAEHYPGASGRIDSIKLTAREFSESDPAYDDGSSILYDDATPVMPG